MPDLTSITSPVRGPYGLAVELPIGPTDGPEVAHWLFTADRVQLHPVWDQWVIACVGLGEVPGLPPPHLQFEGATHEVLIITVDPDHPVTPELVAQPGAKLHYLQPINLAHQFTATDDEMRLLCAGVAWAIVHGYEPPEPPLDYGSFREGWLVSMVKTLAHLRGEEHAP